jgi:hypothetical protein
MDTSEPRSLHMVDIAVHLAGDLIDVARRRRGESYRIGTATVTATEGTVRIGLVTVVMCAAANSPRLARPRTQLRPYAYGRVPRGASGRLARGDADSGGIA